MCQIVAYIVSLRHSFCVKRAVVGLVLAELVEVSKQPQEKASKAGGFDASTSSATTGLATTNSSTHCVSDIVL